MSSINKRKLIFFSTIALSAVCLSAGSFPGQAHAAVGLGASPAVTIDTVAPIVALDPLPANLLVRGGQQVPFHWTTADGHPGTAAADFTAVVEDHGAPVTSRTYLGTWQDTSWDWPAPEMQSGYLSLLVTCRDAFGNTTTARSSEFSVVLSSSGTPTAGLPGAPILDGSSPNPCNPGTTVRFRLPRAQSARLDLFAADGTRIRTLADSEFTAGTHEVFWDGRDDRGRDAASGTYFLRLTADGTQQSRKLALVR